MKHKPILRVEKFVVSELVAVERLAPVSEAMALMREHSVSSLVVNRHDPDDEPGLITVSDIALKVIAENHAPERVNVYEIMSKPVLTVPTDMQGPLCRAPADAFRHFAGGGRGPPSQSGRDGDVAGSCSGACRGLRRERFRPRRR